jgi:hypothetical protein
VKDLPKVAAAEAATISPSAAHIAGIADAAVGIAVAFEVLADAIASAMFIAESKGSAAAERLLATEA